MYHVLTTDPVDLECEELTALTPVILLVSEYISASTSLYSSPVKKYITQINNVQVGNDIE